MNLSILDSFSNKNDCIGNNVNKGKSEIKQTQTKCTIFFLYKAFTIAASSSVLISLYLREKVFLSIIHFFKKRHAYY